MPLARLDNEVIFKKAFTDKLVFTQFVKDILGIEIDVDTIETDKHFKPRVANVDFAYDIFAESRDKRTIIEIQKVNSDYGFKSFLPYHALAIAELQRRTADDPVEKTIYTLVFIMVPYVIKDKQGHLVKDDVLISDVNPKNRQGEIVNLYGHQAIFLNCGYRNEDTPPSYADWLCLVYESLKNPENPNINFKNEAIKRVAELIDEDNLTPGEIRAAKIAAAQEETCKLYERMAKEEGLMEGKLKTAKKMKAKGFDVEIIAEMTGFDADTLNQIEMD
jgi:hypothetical protein